MDRDRDRDYKVTYRTCEVERDADSYETTRRRVPTALDPYLYPEDRDELKRNVALVKVRTRRYDDEKDEVRGGAYPDDRSVRSVKATAAPEGVAGVSAAGPGTTTKTTYAVTEAGIEKERRVVEEPPRRTAASVREYGDYERKSGDRVYERPREEKRFVSGDRECLRREGGAYVLELGDVDVVDVYTGRGVREDDRGFAGYRNDPYSDERRRGYASQREPRYREDDFVYSRRDNARSSASSFYGGAPYMSGARSERDRPPVAAARSQPDFRPAPSRSSTRVFEDEQEIRAEAYGPSRTVQRRDEDDWGIIEKTVTRDSAPEVREDFRDPFAERPRGRMRASTVASQSEHDFVMVSPPRDSATAVSERGRAPAKTAIFNADAYSPEERLRRRRSRSICFRDEDTAGHDIGEKFHERPGAEAAMMGKYLRNYGSDDYRVDYEYSSRDNRRESRRERDQEGARYTPQRIRSRSRRRRERENDDESYISTRHEKIIKDTYY